MEDIVLVTGCHRARSWVISTFSESQADAQVSFGTNFLGGSGVDLEWRDARGGDLKIGPSGRVRIYKTFCLRHSLRDFVPLGLTRGSMLISQRVPRCPLAEFLAKTSGAGNT